MLKKQIGHFIVVSLKYFFDLDYMFCHHAVLMALVCISLIKLFFANIVHLLDEGLHTVQKDFAEIKEGVAAYKEKWAKSEAREVILYNVNILKNIFTAPFRDWRLD